MNQPQATSTVEKEVAAPRPTFDAIPLSPEVRRAVDALGYTHPTPVQLACFEPASRGRSLVVQARTGTGKTAAFGLPIVDGLIKKSLAAVQALVLTPTRELALQVGRELEQLGQFRGIKIVPIYGGAPMGRQIAALEDGAQIVCGTPGRVLDHLRRGTMDPKNIKIFVLDEADEMLSMGFAKELNAIIQTLPKERQGLYFSATIPPDVERLATNHLSDPEWVTLSSDQVGALEIAHYVYLVREGDKRAAIARIVEVEDPESAIVFCNTKDETERVAELLKSRGYEAEWLNGDLAQSDREKVMAATREGKCRFLVATDVAARGIDISHLTHVINADFPESAEQYVHRTGRTGRAGKTGTAISVVGPKDVGHLYMLRLTYKIRPIERSLPTQGELKTRAEADVVAFLADAYAGKAPDPMHLAVARRLLTHDAPELIIAGLLSDHLGPTEEAKQQAADARRAKNPPPVVAPREETPHTLRDGERPARREREPRDRDRDRDRPARAREERSAYDRPVQGSRDDRPVQDARAPRPADERGPRPERAPRPERPARPERDVPRAGIKQATLSQWEPPTDADDDTPIFSEGGTRPGLGPRPDRAATAGTAQPAGARDRNRRGRRPFSEDEGVETDRNPRMPGVTIEDAPTAVMTGSLPREPRERREPREGREPRERREPRPERADRNDDFGPDEIAADQQNLFVNVGRRDGLSTPELQRMLAAAGIPESETGRIRVRDRVSFVAVKKEIADRAIQALSGQVVGGRTVAAEPARS